MDVVTSGLTVASAADWLWEQFGDSLFDDVSDGAKSAWKKLKWQSSQRQYVTRMTYEHSTTSVLGNPKKISLNEVFTDVYVLDQISAFRRLRDEELGRNAHSRLSVEDDLKRKPLLDVMQKSSRLYVLGKPGAGKSTFLKKVVLECCSGRINKTPIFIGLKSWSDSQLSLTSYIEQEFEICAFPHAGPFVERLLKGGRAIVLFDGLDEVSNTVGERSLLTDRLTAFTRKYPEILIVVTCRIAATDYSFDKFTYVEIADFDGQQQLTFASKWFANDEGSDTAELLHTEERVAVLLRIEVMNKCNELRNNLTVRW